MKKSIFNRHGVAINATSMQDAMQQSKLDYHVEKRSAYYKSNEAYVEIKDKFHTVRTDTEKYLGTVGKQYEVCQNVHCFEFFDKLVLEHKDIKYETVGTIDEGRVMWVQAKLPTYIKVGENDLTNMYVTLINSHDGSTAIHAKITPIRIICQNTLTACINQKKDSISIMHNGSLKEKLNKAHDILNISYKFAEELTTTFNIWAKKKISDKKALTIFEKLVEIDHNVEVTSRKKNLLLGLEEFHLAGIGQNIETTAGTVFGLYNAVTGFLDHEKYGKDDEKKS